MPQPGGQASSTPFPGGEAKAQADEGLFSNVKKQVLQIQGVISFPLACIAPPSNNSFIQ
jgi:hypothetical protein